jgi:hypothetical protein
MSVSDVERRELLAIHHERMRGQLEVFRGTEVDTTGDSMLAMFDGAAGADRPSLDMPAHDQALTDGPERGADSGDCEQAEVPRHRELFDVPPAIRPPKDQRIEALLGAVADRPRSTPIGIDAVQVVASPRPTPNHRQRQPQSR